MDNTALANELLENKLFMHLVTERAKRGEEITEETILAALADERAVILRNLERISEMAPTRSCTEKSESNKAIRNVMAERVYRTFWDESANEMRGEWV